MNTLGLAYLIKIRYKENMEKKNKTYVLEIHFQNENDLKKYVQDEFQSGVVAAKKTAADEMHLRTYTKKTFTLKPENDPELLGHYAVK